MFHMLHSPILFIALGWNLYNHLTRAVYSPASDPVKPVMTVIPSVSHSVRPFVRDCPGMYEESSGPILINCQPKNSSVCGKGSMNRCQSYVRYQAILEHRVRYL